MELLSITVNYVYKMSKRHRAVHIRPDNDDIIISTYYHWQRMPNIISWSSQDVPSDVNPEETLHYLVIRSSPGIFRIRCKDEHERNDIVNELKENPF